MEMETIKILIISRLFSVLCLFSLEVVSLMSESPCRKVPLAKNIVNIPNQQ